MLQERTKQEEKEGSEQYHGNRRSKEEWARIEAGVDSCAVEHVCPPHLFPLIPRVETMASLSGKKYSAANGSPIYNEGEKTVDFFTDCGKKQKVRFQLTKVTEVLLSAENSASWIQRRPEREEPENHEHQNARTYTD